MLIVDYLQLVRPATAKDSRVNEVSEITQGLKAIAKELDIPVIALSQLSRQVENRDDKRPQLADLRESGSIEQDADVVMFIMRPSVYDRVLAMNMFGTKTVLLLSVIAFLYGRPDFLDLALAYALINFIGVLAVLEFFKSRAARRAQEEEERRST